ncbi:hypothetical protein NL529_30265, partial [Klebsiella pneumoniae]|nr:hypothetical protein [Klebsiella pneumoniae]
ENDYQQNDKVNAQLSKILANHTYRVVDVNSELESSLTFGQRVADGSFCAPTRTKSVLLRAQRNAGIVA